MRRSAFTLIEVLAVVTILALVAGATIWSLAADVRRGTCADAIGRVAWADRTARLAARRLGRPCGLRFDLDARRLWRIEDDGLRTTHEVALPGGYHIDRLIIAATGGAADYGAIDVAYSIAGRSTDYAVHLTSRDGSDGTWIVISGLTGQVTSDLHENEVHNLFTALAAGRPDAS